MYKPSPRIMPKRFAFAVVLTLSICLAPISSRSIAQPLNRSTAQPVLPGISVLLQDSLHLVQGKRVGLITNHTGRDEQGRSSIDLLYSAPGVRLTALFSPEHGIRGNVEGGERVNSTVDRKTGVPIYSLYGETLAPTKKMLENVDVLIYDIQDVGARMYTYIWTMTLAAEVAHEAGRKFIVLDRPSPIRADIVEGGMIEKRFRSFTGLHNVPARYGLTVGELARYLTAEKILPGEITVVPMLGYRRSMWWNETGLDWVNPSPNIRDPVTALLYPGLSFFEATNMSEGRGTDAPLKQVGAKWLTDAPEIARLMNARRLPGVQFTAISRRVARGEKFGGQTIPMIKVSVTDRDSIRPVEIASHLLREIYQRHPRELKWEEKGIERLSGSPDLRSAVEHGGIDQLLARWRRESAHFRTETMPYYLYPP
jgi:uncharacterized protein YbbC (DUF1343 family)